MNGAYGEPARRPGQTYRETPADPSGVGRAHRSHTSRLFVLAVCFGALALAVRFGRTPVGRYVYLGLFIVTFWLSTIMLSVGSRYWEYLHGALLG